MGNNKSSTDRNSDQRQVAEQSHLSAQVHTESDRGLPQKRASANSSTAASDAASSTLFLSTLLEQQNSPILDESSLSLLSSLKTLTSDEKISQGGVGKQVDKIKQLVSSIQTSCQRLNDREAALKKATQLLLKIQQEKAKIREAMDSKHSLEKGEYSNEEAALQKQKLQKEDLRRSALLQQLYQGVNSVVAVAAQGENITTNHSTRALKEREQHTREELEKLKEQVEQYKRLVEEVKQQVAPASPPKEKEVVSKARHDQKQAEIERLAKDVEICKDELQQLLATIAQEQSMMQQVYDLQNKLKKDKQQFGQMQQQLTKEQNKVKEGKKMNKKLRAQIDRDRSFLDKERQNHKKREEDLKNERAKIKKAMEEMQNGRKGVEHDRAQLKREHKKLDRKKDEVADETKKLEVERKKMQKEKERLKKEVQKAQNAKDKIEKEKQRADQEASNAQKRKEKIMADIQKAIVEEERKLKELKEIEKTKAQLKGELEQLKKEKRKMEKRRSKSPGHHNTTGNGAEGGGKQSSSDELGVGGASSETSIALRQKLLQLENENKVLKKKIEASSSPASFSSALGPSSTSTSYHQQDVAWPNRGVSGSKGGGESKVGGSSGTSSGPSGGGSSNTINTFSFSQNSWLRSMKSSMMNPVKDTINIPRFAWPRPGMKEHHSSHHHQHSSHHHPSSLSSSTHGSSSNSSSHHHHHQIHHHPAHHGGLSATSTFGGPPGFAGTSSSQPMGGLMFAQRGKKVMARYRGDDQWYDAEIKEVILNGAKGPRYIVKFQGYAGKEEQVGQEAVLV
eukprot:jgi/Bigna1/80518/fgenesh1_pg.71_\